MHVGRRVDAATGTATDFVSYSGPGTAYPGENNPWNVYRAMMNIGSGSEAEARILKRRQSVAALVQDDLQTLRRLPMSQDDRKKIDDWLSVIRDTENQMVTTSSCSPSTPGDLGITGAERYDGMGNDQLASDAEFREIGNLMIRMAALATVCDVNRVITLQWSSGAGGPTFRREMNFDFTHHQLSHRTGRDDASGTDLPGIDAMVGAIDRWYAARFADLLGLLDRFKEGDGQSVLDSCAAMWINELSDRKAHSFINLPIVIAGSAGGVLRQGQVVDCTPDGNLEAAQGVPHNKLLTTLLNAVGTRAEDGSPLTGFGDLQHGAPGEYEMLKA